jgi:hypothetical protein
MDVSEECIVSTFRAEEKARKKERKEERNQQEVGSKKRLACFIITSAWHTFRP